MRNKVKPFAFQQFTIEQNKSAMKVGTDGVLLGAWTEVKNAESILDIGTGTGLLALMLAQKTRAEIHAVELDSDAAEEAKTNFLSSPWSSQISLWNASIQVFAEVVEYSYDLIISNPPYFNDNSNPSNRETARSQVDLTYADLIHVVDKLLKPNGRFCLILPKESEEEILTIAKNSGLFLAKSCSIYGNTKSPCKRILLEFSRIKIQPRHSQLTIEKEKRHDYTDTYMNLVKDYLLIGK